MAFVTVFWGVVMAGANLLVLNRDQSVTATLAEVALGMIIFATLYGALMRAWLLRQQRQKEAGHDTVVTD